MNALGNRSRWLPCIFAIFLLRTSFLLADSVTENGVKAGFIYNFTKFVEWPPPAFTSAQAPMRLCVLGDKPINGDLQLLSQYQTQGHPIQVAVNPPRQDWAGCHVIYFGVDMESRFKAVLDGLGNTPALTVSDIPAFAEQGGMIGLYLQTGRVQFAINLAVARRADLKLSAQLLNLARIVE